MPVMAGHDEQRQLIVRVAQRVLLLRREPLLRSRALRLRTACRDRANQQQDRELKGSAYTRPHSSRALRRRLHLKSLLPRASVCWPRLTRHALALTAPAAFAPL